LKQVAVLSLLWGKHLDPLFEYLKNVPKNKTQTVIVAAPSLEYYKEAFSSTHIHIISIESFLNNNDLVEVNNTVNIKIKTIEKFILTPEYAQFSKNLNVDIKIAQELIGSLRERLFQEIVYLHALEKARIEFDFEIILLSEDVLSLSRTIVLWAEEHDIESLYITHGTAGLQKPYSIHKKFHAKHTAVYGNQAKLAFLNRQEGQIHITGSSEYDSYQDNVEQKEHIRKLICEKYSIDKKAIIVMFGTTWGAQLSALTDQSIHEKTLKSIFSAYSFCKNSGLNIHLVIKDRESNMQLEGNQHLIYTLAKNAGLKEDEFVYTGSDTQALVLASNLMISVDSSLSVEAMHARTPAINLTNISGLFMGPSLSKHDGISEVYLEESNALGKEIVKITTNTLVQKSMIEKMSKQVEFHNSTAFTGSATKNIRLLIEKLAKQSLTKNIKEKKMSTYIWETLDALDDNDVTDLYHTTPRLELFHLFEHKPKRYLEIGCGAGATIKEIKKRYPTCFTVGVELNKKAAAYASKFSDVLIDQPLEDVRLEDFGIEKGSIDTVILADVLEHMYNPWGALRDILPYLTEDAQVVSSIPNIRNLWILNEMINGRWTYESAGLLDVTHIRFFTWSEIKKMFDETGYDILKSGRTYDARVNLNVPSGTTTLDLGRIVLKDLTAEEIEDYKTLQFLVLAKPKLRTTPSLEKDEAVSDVIKLDMSTCLTSMAPSHPATQEIASNNSASKQIIVFLGNPLDEMGYIDLTLGLLSPISNLKDYQILPLLKKVKGKYELDIDLLEKASLIIIHDRGALFSSLLPYLKMTGVPLCFYIATDIWSLSEKSRDKEYFEALETHYEKCLQYADSVITTNEYINIKIARETAVLTPLIDPSLWKLPVQYTENDTGKVIVALYADSSNLDDIMLIAEVLIKLQKKYSDTAHFILYAINCTSAELTGFKFIDIRMIACSDYIEYVNLIRSQPVDIVLCPLSNNEPNLSRSPHKYFEQALTNVAGIYSNFGLYKETIEHGLTGYLCSDNMKEWENAICALIEEPEIRTNMAIQAEKNVRTHFTVDNSLIKMQKFLSEHVKEVENKKFNKELFQKFSRYDIDALLYYNKWLSIKEVKPEDFIMWESISKQWSAEPIFHFFLYVEDKNIEFLAQTIDSFSNQMYPNWCLHFISELEVPHAGFEDTNNLNWIQTDASLYDASNQIGKNLVNSFVGMLNVGDLLAPHALISLCQIYNEKESSLIYTDHDIVDNIGFRNFPKFKPDFNLEMLRSSDYISNAFVMEIEAFKKLKGYKIELLGSENIDILLRFYDTFKEQSIYHLPDVLFTLTKEEDTLMQLKLVSTKLALSQHLQRNNIAGEILEGEVEGTFRVLYYHEEKPLVSILIPTKDQFEYISACISSIFDKTSYENYEIIIVDNGSTGEAKEYLEDINSKYDNLQVIAYDKAFNFSTVNNTAAAEAQGEYLLLLNNDTEILHENWLDVLLSYAQREDVGIVGMRLLYPDNTIQHAGVIMGLSGCADHQFSQCSLEDDGYMSRLKIDQELSVVTAAALLIRKSVYDEVGGLNDTDYRLNFSDVDLCLKVREAGHKVLWTPHCTLLHHGSVTQKSIDTKKSKEKEKLFAKDKEALLRLWIDYVNHDPAYNINLDIGNPYMSIRTKALPHWTVSQNTTLPKIFAFARGKDGSGFYRIKTPLDGLSKAGYAQTYVEYKGYHTVYVGAQKPDVIVYQIPLHDHHLSFLEDIKKTYPQITLIFEIDDLLTNIPISNRSFLNQYKDVRNRFKKALSFCDRMIVSTKPLKEAFSSYHDDIRVVPNYLSNEIWGNLKQDRIHSDKLRVGWAGSIFHKGDLEIVRQLIIDYKDTVQWVFMGMAPEGIDEYIEYHPGVSVEKYPEKLATLNLDLALVPLEKNSFNESKSNLRLLEFGILGWPVICTDIYPYQDAPVTRVKNRYKDWVRAFKEKIKDREALVKEGETLKQWVKDNYILENNLEFIAKQYL